MSTEITRIRVKTEFGGPKKDDFLKHGYPIEVEESYTGKTLKEAWANFRYFFSAYRKAIGPRVNVEVSIDGTTNTYDYEVEDFWERFYERKDFEFAPPEYKREFSKIPPRDFLKENICK
ncbi:hypothetical protein BKH46_08285 [Helicobacter sp. 12S02634-8]|uniref:hypothetical protein n=1 Tax=Helicobacter sp. 12S02634-8 TaxID=1476199 RepID=UPI000BA7915E|nr:hypothetical protein [Helicobacter sp. 12S02634-8]PAF46228.1 hypothetical protein BKH46_08285 [Helicobacter sp. 12S02634-8]